MKTPVLLISIVTLSLAGCSQPLMKESKETVIEKPVAVQPSREIVVEKPHVTREIIVERPVATPRPCTYGPAAFSHGSMSCQGGYQFRCLDGTWQGLNTLC